MKDMGRMYFRMGQVQHFLEDICKKKIDLIRITTYEPIYKSKDAREHFQKVKKEIIDTVILGNDDKVYWRLIKDIRSNMVHEY